ncbi:glycosyltransferase family 2 protein [Ralstonia soli]|uniref:Glycosyltransferase family 2 protein n=1 Tax=Ralstonia soli TaxID=2953896 RepID=A0ABT1AGR4_9RALS|nr:glycosyltransferase family 2 protein [Ralstonia soli]MCO5397489.1 glycosyltransferase family 2 protein [Ralstonia soli]
MSGVSVLILTKNEALDIAGCLRALSGLSDIHVLDSQSTDNTREIAAAHGAKVSIRPFDNYAAQRNFGLHTLPFENDWVLILDADERASPELIQECLALAAGAPDHVAAGRLRRDDYWMGKHLKRSVISPLFIRLVRRTRVHYEREINEVLVVDGTIVDLSHHFDHFSFSKGMAHWLSKHNMYSTMEAELIVSNRVGKPSIGTALFGRDPNERRLHQKRLFYRMPGRPLLKFFYMMGCRRAWLDGWIGLHYSLLQCIYEYMIVLKVRELEHPAVQDDDIRPARAADV